MHLFVGTSGYSYKEWVGKFYPDKLPASAMLGYYAERFTTVEINNSFYRMPAETMLVRWAKEAPEQFVFTLKAPRRITHEKRLRGAEADVAEFIRRASVLGKKLGVLLFQLPPFHKKDLSLLKDFLGLLPSGQQAAFEFRHASWQHDDVYEALRVHGAMMCMAETDESATKLVSTSDRGYLRLRRAQYNDDALLAWIARIAAQPWERAYIYFKHEDEARGPRFAQRFIELWHTKAHE